MFTVTHVGNRVNRNLQNARLQQLDQEGMPPQIIVWGWQFLLWETNVLELCNLGTGTSRKINHIQFVR